MSDALAIRRLDATELDALNEELPSWSAGEYDRRLRAQGRGQMVQAVGWLAGRPVGRGMVLFPEHDEFSPSAVREGCAEVRDVFVLRQRRRLGIATAIMAELEEAAREQGMGRVGLSVAVAEEGAAARALYAILGYRHAHGPYVSSTTLTGDEGPIPVSAVLTYLIKDL